MGIGLANEGKAVLLVDFDPQESLTTQLGLDPQDFTDNIATMVEKAASNMMASFAGGVVQHSEGVDVIPGNIDLSALDRDLWNCMQPYGALSTVLNSFRRKYDYIIVDCGPSLSILTLNALTAADSALIPVQAEIQSLRGTSHLLSTIHRTRQQIRPQLKIKGMLMTMVSRTNHARDSVDDVRETFTGKLHVFKAAIPRSIDAAEGSKHGQSVYKYRPHNPMGLAYKQFVQEVISLEKARTRPEKAVGI